MSREAGVLCPHMPLNIAGWVLGMGYVIAHALLSFDTSCMPSATPMLLSSLISSSLSVRSWENNLASAPRIPRVFTMVYSWWASTSLGVSLLWVSSDSEYGRSRLPMTSSYSMCLVGLGLALSTRSFRLPDWSITGLVQRGY